MIEKQWFRYRTKNAGRPAAVEENELWEDGKTMENTSINLYYIGFFIITKKIAKN